MKLVHLSDIHIGLNGAQVDLSRAERGIHFHMKVLVIGRGAREHALGWKIKQSKFLSELFFAPGNAGTAILGTNLDFDPAQIIQLADWASAHKIELTIVGPENPLMLGINEEFSRRGLLLFGPPREGAKLEGSKIWAKDFLMKYSIPTAMGREFTDFQTAAQYARRHAYPLVVKADGLAEGKGVAVCQNVEEAQKALRSFMVDKSVGKAGDKILIEDFLSGEEISAFAVCDGKRFCYLGEARDYKRAHDGDSGPNTGGMGAASGPELLSQSLRDEICEKIFKPAFEGLTRENIRYQGVLYAGLMLTREGPKVLEFNVRFGDPETQVLLPRIENDLLPILKKCAGGNLANEEVKLKPEFAVGVVVAAGGYPGQVEKGLKLPDLGKFSKDLLVFHAATIMDQGHLVNQGGRTLTIVALAKTIEEARAKVYVGLERQSWGSYFYRKDIGSTGTHPTVSSKSAGCVPVNPGSLS